MGRYDGHGDTCEVCGGPSDTMVNCFGDYHSHILCEPCDRYLTGIGWTWAGGPKPRCPNEITAANREATLVLIALQEGPND